MLGAQLGILKGSRILYKFETFSFFGGGGGGGGSKIREPNPTSFNEKFYGRDVSLPENYYPPPVQVSQGNLDVS